MNKFYVIIYHPSRFVCIIHLYILIYRHLNSVIDTSKTEISLTLSITIWGYPSRYSHYTLPDTAYHCWNTCDRLTYTDIDRHIVNRYVIPLSHRYAGYSLRAGDNISTKHKEVRSFLTADCKFAGTPSGEKAYPVLLIENSNYRLLKIF